MRTLIVLAKAPAPGLVKTRLVPPYTPKQAADLATAALRDTLDTVLATPACRRVLALDGAPGDWLPSGFEVVPQRSGGLDARIACALAVARGPALLVGMDTPQLTPRLLGVDSSGADAWFGPATDGGFWALGLRRPSPGLLDRLLLGVPMSAARTGEALLDRLGAEGLSVATLPRLRDVDTPTDATVVAAQAPGTRFARLLTRLRDSDPPR